MLMLSEEELIRGCIEGNKQIQKQLYQRYASTMFGLCLRYFTEREEAEDAMQEGFIKVFNNIGKFRHEGSLEGWIKRIMVNTSLNLFRNHQKHYYHADVEEVADEVPDEGDIMQEFSQQDLLKTLQGLPPGYRMVFNLYEIEGYNHKEIAGLMGISVNTSKTQLLKARRLLHKRLTILNQGAIFSRDDGREK